MRKALIVLIVLLGVFLAIGCAGQKGESPNKTETVQTVNETKVVKETPVKSVNRTTIEGNNTTVNRTVIRGNNTTVNRTTIKDNNTTVNRTVIRGNNTTVNRTTIKGNNTTAARTTVVKTTSKK